MEGEEIKNKLLEAGFKLSVVAKDMNISHQAFFSKLDSKDVKVSLIYDICNATGLDLSYFLDKYLSAEQRKYSI